MSDSKGTESGTDTTRQRIIDAANSLFQQIGYARTTTRAIAAEAGINEVTLFRHFGNKKNLLQVCVETINAGGFSANFEKAMTGNYAEDILIMAREQIADMDAGYEALRLVMCEAAHFEELREAVLMGSSQNDARVADYFRRQIEAGVVSDKFEPIALAHAFHCLFLTSVLYQHLIGFNLLGGLDGGVLIQQFADLFVRGTINNQKKE